MATYVLVEVGGGISRAPDRNAGSHFGGRKSIIAAQKVYQTPLRDTPERFVS